MLFGIKEDFTEGSSFSEEHQKARRETEKSEREEKYKNRDKKKKVNRMFFNCFISNIHILE